MFLGCVAAGILLGRTATAHAWSCSEEVDLEKERFEAADAAEDRPENDFWPSHAEITFDARFGSSTINFRGEQP
jgi:hypothetical protein